MQTVARRTKKPRFTEPAARGMAIRIAGQMEIPDWVRDHDSFRRWARSPQCPEKARLAFYFGNLWVDPEMEQLYVHNRVILKIANTLDSLIESLDLGTYVGDGMLLTHAAVGLSTVPDGIFFSFSALESGRIREVAGVRHGCVELEGSPEMVLEVVSDSSEEKDLVDLRTLYWKAGVDEYWLVDARTEDVRFEVLRRTAAGYSSTRKQAGGWVRSDLFDASFHLVKLENRAGRPNYKLEVRV